MVDEASVRAPVPEELLRAAQDQGWPDGLLQRALNLRVSPGTIRRWLASDWADTTYIERRVVWHERLTFGSLRGREATLADNDGFADLWANSPEELGEWEVITERGPNAFAQFQLQENVTLSVIEDQGRLVASCSWSTRNVVVGGKRLTVRYGQALRVRKEYRRQGYGDQVRSLSWGVGAGSRPSATQYDYMRSQNFAVLNWWKKYDPEFFDHVPKREGDVPGISVSVLQYPRRPFEGDPAGIRRARRSDIRRCVGLINRTHRGSDLFRPYTMEFLQQALDEGFWGASPPEWVSVYRWQDYYVLEEQGRIVACAGLWDRGRDLREKWRRQSRTEEKVIAAAAVLDFGHEAGHETSLARLIGYLIGETDRLARDHLVVPLDQMPELAALLEEYGPIPETRALRWDLRDPVVTRPYTDLRYW